MYQVSIGFQHRLAHLHAVLCQRARLVGAYHCRCAHSLAGMQLAHEIVGAQHLTHAVCQRQRHRHRQTLRHGNYHKRYGNHYRLKQICKHVRHRLRRRQHGSIRHVPVEIDYHPADKYCRSYDVAYFRYQASQFRQLLVERRLHLI